MIRLKRAICCSYILVAGSAGLAAPKQNRPAASEKVGAQKASESKETWPQGMKNLAQAFSNAFPFVYSAYEITSPENKQAITAYISRLKTSAHTLPVEQGKALLGDEPLVALFPKLLQTEVLTAEANYQKKLFSEAQQSFKGITNLCFFCHLTHQVGPKFDSTNSEIIGISASLREKAVALIALRQFDSAAALIRKELEK
jgi:hypothetical protein